MSAYTFTAAQPGVAVAHGDHIWETWNAYLSEDLPDWANGNDTGICCHTCRTILVDRPAPPVDRPTPTTHAPAAWTVVNNSPLIVSAMCVCGDDECAFTATAYTAVNTALDAVGNVPV